MHFLTKLEAALEHYKGSEVGKYAKINLKREVEGINIAYMQLIQQVMRVLWLKKFFNDFVLDDLIILNERNEGIIAFQDNIGLIIDKL